MTSLGQRLTQYGNSLTERGPLRTETLAIGPASGTWHLPSDALAAMSRSSALHVQVADCL